MGFLRDSFTCRSSVVVRESRVKVEIQLRSEPQATTTFSTLLTTFHSIFSLMLHFLCRFSSFGIYES